MSGTTSDVGGMISASSRKKTVRDSRIEIHSDIFSPTEKKTRQRKGVLFVGLENN